MDRLNGFNCSCPSGYKGSRCENGQYIYYVFYCKFKHLGCMEFRQDKRRKDDLMGTNLNWEQEEREEEKQEKEKEKKGWKRIKRTSILPVFFAVI